MSSDFALDAVFSSPANDVQWSNVIFSCRSESLNKNENGFEEPVESESCAFMHDAGTRCSMRLHNHMTNRYF